MEFLATGGHVHNRGGESNHITGSGLVSGVPAWPPRFCLLPWSAGDLEPLSLLLGRVVHTASTSNAMHAQLANMHTHEQDEAMAIQAGTASWEKSFGKPGGLNACRAL